MPRALALLALSPLLLTAREERDPLVTVQEGALPILLSAPHGGRKAVPGAPVRKGEGVIKFVTVRDTATDVLATKLAAAIEKKMGAKPYLVVARFDRKYIDANRDAKNAYESDKARPYYDAYHRALGDAKKKIEKDWGRGLLLDLHGQAVWADTIFRGTLNGNSVKHLTDRFGKAALIGPKSLLGVLEKKGYRIDPPCAAKDGKETRFTGGYITQAYGSKDGGSFDAIQLELGGDARAAKALDKTAADLADALAAFGKEYLPAKKR